jgi:hypothetical protein
MATARMEVDEAASRDSVFLLRQEVNVARPQSRRAINASVLYSANCFTSLITHGLAKELELEGSEMPVSYVDPKGKHGIARMCYTIELRSMGEKRSELLQVWGVDKLPSYPAQDPPPRLRARFPLCKMASSTYRLEAMTIEVMIGYDNRKLLPQLLSDSVIPGERLSLYRSRFMPYDLVGGTASDLTSDLLEASKQIVASRRRSPPRIMRRRDSNTANSSASSRTSSSSSTPWGPRRSTHRQEKEDAGRGDKRGRGEDARSRTGGRAPPASTSVPVARPARSPARPARPVPIVKCDRAARRTEEASNEAGAGRPVNVARKSDRILPKAA